MPVLQSIEDLGMSHALAPCGIVPVHGHKAHKCVSASEHRRFGHVICTGSLWDGACAWSRMHEINLQALLLDLLWQLSSCLDTGHTPLKASRHADAHESWCILQFNVTGMCPCQPFVSPPLGLLNLLDSSQTKHKCTSRCFKHTNRSQMEFLSIFNNSVAPLLLSTCFIQCPMQTRFLLLHAHKQVALLQGDAA